LTTQDLYEDDEMAIWKDDDEMITKMLFGRGIMLLFDAEELSKFTSGLIKAREKS